MVCQELSWIHFEVKCVERLNIEEAVDQARRECGGKTPVVAHKRNYRAWLVTMSAETFFRLVRGDFPQEAAKEAEEAKQNRNGARVTRPSDKEIENFGSQEAQHAPEAGGEKQPVRNQR